MFSGYTGISQSVCLSVCVQNTTFCRSAGGGGGVWWFQVTFSDSSSLECRHVSFDQFTEAEMLENVIKTLQFMVNQNSFCHKLSKKRDCETVYQAYVF